MTGGAARPVEEDGVPRDLRGATLLGDFAHAPVLGAVERMDGALVAIDAGGDIAAVIRAGEPDHSPALAAARAAGRLERLPEGCVALPGFVDLHVHAPQHPQLGLALDRPLESWLFDYTFPLEARFADLGFARRAYAALVDDLLSRGTTTALMFATIHRDATRALADISLERGLRALVGKVSMDHPEGCPDYYRDVSADAAVEGARDLIAHVAGLGAGGMLAAVVTPRFIPACTDAALEGLGALARETGARVQTHAAESDWEVAHVRERTGLSDAEALDRFGLLGPRSVLAHGVFLDDADLRLMARRGAAVAHCALSNAYFAGAVFPLRAALEKGLRVGLGTDVSGGPDASMWSAMRMTVAASRMLASGVDPDRPAAQRGRPGAAVDWRAAFHLATAGGAAALDLPVGAFRPGLRFDAVAVRDAAAVEGGSAGLAAPEARLARLLHGAGREDIRAVYTDGVRRVPAPV